MLRENIKAVAAVFLVSAFMETSIADAQTQAPPVAGSNTFSVNETHGDWIVLCSEQDKSQTCLMTQQQRKTDTNQLVIAAEISAGENNQARGTLVLPFGLGLEAGMTFQVDNGPVSKPARFSTCVPAGCIVQVLFDAPTLESLRAGSTVKLVTKAHETGQDVILGLSLKGFATALDRLQTLSQ